MEYVITALNVLLIILAVTIFKESFEELTPSRATLALKRNSARVNRKYQYLGFNGSIAFFSTVAMTTSLWCSWFVAIAIVGFFIIEVRNVRIADDNKELDNEFDVQYDKWRGLTVIGKDKDLDK